MRVVVLCLAVAWAVASASPAAAKDKYNALSIGPDALRGAAITYVGRDVMPGFLILRPSQGAFAVVGALAAAASSKNFWAENSMQEPANAVNERVARDVAAQYGMIAAPGVIISQQTSFADISGKAGGARYILNVQSRAINVTYLPTRWSNYQLQYIAGADLIDVATGKSVASGLCTAPKRPSGLAPTYDEMSANQAALLKEMIASAAAHCEDQFRTKLFNLASTPSALGAEQGVASPPPPALTAEPTS